MSRYRLATALLVFPLLLPVFAGPQNDKPMTNQDVIRLVKLGLSQEVIITKISESPVAFDVSIDGLTALAQNRVPNEVIKIMQSRAAGQPSKSNTSGTSTTSPPPKVASASNQRSSYPRPPDKGAYLWDGTKLELLYQNPVTSIGQNFVKKFIPFAKKRIELQLIGPFANRHFDNSHPTILVSGLGDVIPGVPAFRWLYVKTGGMKKDRRIVGTYDVGGFFGSIQMVDNEIECEIKKISEGVYAIAPLKPLRDGEYGLVQVPKLADMSTRPSFAPPIWDFGVYAEGRSGVKTQ